MGKGASRLAAARLGRRSPVNTGASWPTPEEAEARVLHHQRKLHKWATTDNDGQEVPRPVEPRVRPRHPPGGVAPGQGQQGLTDRRDRWTDPVTRTASPWGPLVRQLPAQVRCGRRVL